MGTIYPFVPTIVNELLPPGGRVLEIGCGAKQYRPLLSGEYVGLDLPDSPYLEDPPEIAGSAESIAAPDASFDVVFAVATFLIVPDIKAAFAECRRVLRPGGSLAVFDYQESVCRRLRAQDPNHRHAWGFADLAGLLRECGFDDVRDRTGQLAGLPWRDRVRRSLGPLLRPIGAEFPWLAVVARR